LHTIATCNRVAATVFYDVQLLVFFVKFSGLPSSKKSCGCVWTRTLHSDRLPHNFARFGLFAMLMLNVLQFSPGAWKRIALVF